MKETYQWLFSDKEEHGGQIDIHFVLNTNTGEVKKIVQRRTIISRGVERVVGL